MYNNSNQCFPSSDCAQCSGMSVRYHRNFQVIAISNVSKDLKNGDVYFEPIYRYKEDSPAEEPYWEKMGELK